MQSVENLSHYQRRATPLPFARHLVSRVRHMFGCDLVAVLWVERRSPYWSLWPGIELWGIGRDARTYAGPHPVICHPPCGPWGKYRSVSHESKDHGVAAMHMVHWYGGCVEHPVGSSLFRDLGLPDGVIERIDQSAFGHMAKKPTMIYWHRGGIHE